MQLLSMKHLRRGGTDFRAPIFITSYPLCCRRTAWAVRGAPQRTCLLALTRHLRLHLQKHLLGAVLCGSACVSGRWQASSQEGGPAATGGEPCSLRSPPVETHTGSPGRDLARVQVKDGARTCTSLPSPNPFPFRPL